VAGYYRPPRLGEEISLTAATTEPASPTGQLSARASETSITRLEMTPGLPAVHVTELLGGSEAPQVSRRQAHPTDACAEPEQSL
jgi:hypothetical protein